MPNTLPRITAIILLISGIAVPEALGLWDDTYSSTTHYLSELGALGTPTYTIANWVGFLPVGLAMLFLLAYLWHALPPTVLIRLGLFGMFGMVVGYIGAFFYPCDLGCPADGLGRQAIHNLSGVYAYLSALVGLPLLALGLRRTMPRAAGITLVTFLCVVIASYLMAAPDLQGFRGLSQRLADYSIFLWVAAVTFQRKQP